MILYHGTNLDFQVIDIKKSRKNKDFGQGFYLTEDFNKAERLANQRCMVEGGQPVVLKYEFDYDAAIKDASLKILRFENYSTDWASFVNINRNTQYSDKMHDYDIVYGPIANDKVGLQVMLFNQQLIDIETLMTRLKFVTPTFQYYFGTIASLKYLTRA